MTTRPGNGRCASVIQTRQVSSSSTMPVAHHAVCSKWGNTTSATATSSTRTSRRSRAALDVCGPNTRAMGPSRARSGPAEEFAGTAVFIAAAWDSRVVQRQRAQAVLAMLRAGTCKGECAGNAQRVAHVRGVGVQHPARQPGKLLLDIQLGADRIEVQQQIAATLRVEL